MSGFSDYMAAAVCSFYKGTAFPTPPSSIYIALFSADPTDAGSLTNEVTTTIRTAGRVAIPSSGWSAINTSVTGQRTISNSAIVDFGNAAGTANIPYWGAFDAATGGNMLDSGSSGTTSASTGNAVNFPVGALVLGAA